MNYQSMAVGEIVFVHTLFFIALAYMAIPLFLFYDLLIGRAIDSIQKKEPRFIYFPDVNKIGFLRFLLFWPIVCTGILQFWHFSRRRKMIIAIIAFIFAIVIPFFWDSNS